MEEFNVVCRACDSVKTVSGGSAFGWRAKKRAERYFDALSISGEECGCIERKIEPDAPYRVIGFDDLCRDFDIPFNSFTLAVKTYLGASRSGYNVFIQGVSPKVKESLLSF